MRYSITMGTNDNFATDMKIVESKTIREASILAQGMAEENAIKTLPYDIPEYKIKEYIDSAWYEIKEVGVDK